MYKYTHVHVSGQHARKQGPVGTKCGRGACDSGRGARKAVTAEEATFQVRRIVSEYGRNGAVFQGSMTRCLCSEVAACSHFYISPLGFQC